MMKAGYQSGSRRAIPGKAICTTDCGTGRSITMVRGFEVGVHCWDHVRWQDSVAGANAIWTLLYSIGISTWLLPVFIGWVLYLSIRSSRHLTTGRTIAMVITCVSCAGLAAMVAATSLTPGTCSAFLTAPEPRPPQPTKPILISSLPAACAIRRRVAGWHTR